MDKRGTYQCGECGGRHQNYIKYCPVKLAETEAREQADSVAWKAKPRPPVQILRRPDPDGRRVWGDRLLTMDRQGENSFRHKKGA